LLIYNKSMRKVAIENDGTKAKILLIGKDGDASYRELPRGIITLERLKEYENPITPNN
jgi:hypothetical protein